jgi:hypothetical protein
MLPLSCMYSDDSDASDNSADEMLEKNIRCYISALRHFEHYQNSSLLLQGILPRIESLPPYTADPEDARARSHLLDMGVFGSNLMDLNDRPRSPFPFPGLSLLSPALAAAEFDLFLKALRLTWKILPDYSIGLHMLLDWLAETMDTEDIACLDQETIAVLKSITSARCSNSLMEMTLSSAAKTILARHSRKASFAQATTVGIVRTFAKIDETKSHIFDDDYEEKKAANLIAAINLEAVQPKRKQAVFGDCRRICDHALCTNVESGEKKFPKCGACGMVAYCSKSCQKEHWKMHKGDCKGKGKGKGK